ncbi:MAG: hypothetical protein COA38_02665 [Fluviicola sp.]|nr:MAG: hypothetical protein COA38_02665 [Fluviicola sp.]
MNLLKVLLVGVTTFLSITTSAQDDNLICDRLKFLAGESIVLNDFKTATAYYLKGEISCGDYDQANWDRLLGSIKYVINQDEDENARKNYIDTLLNAWDRQELAGFYQEMYDLERGMYIMQSAKPDYAKADIFFQRGIKAQGEKTHEAYLVYAFYTTYFLYNNAKGDKKAKLKTRMISDYFFYTEISDKTGMSDLTHEALDTYFDYVVESCDDLLPTVQDYIEALTEDTVAAIHSIQQMTTLLEGKGCTGSKEYRELLDAWLELEPYSWEANHKKNPISNEADAITRLDYYMLRTKDPDMKAELQYKKAYIQFNAGQYKAAYETGKSCTGKYKSDGLSIAAKCVATMANSCGDSTFERKCNYIYAAQLAERAGKSGAGYRAKASSDCYPEDMKQVFLNCWGVTVNACR